MSKVPIIEVNIDDNSSKKDEKVENPSSKNTTKEEIKESLSISEAEIKKKRIIKVQEDNINGNYGRIYIQESSSNRDGNKFNTNSDKTKEKPVQQREVKKTIITINSNKKTDNNKRPKPISIDNKYVKKKVEEKNNNIPKKYNLRRKSVGRGGDYKNILITHIIYSPEDLDFHIIDPLMIPTEQENKKYKTSIDDKNRNGKNGEVKVSYHYSCGKIKPKEKSKLNGKTTVATRRYNASTVKVNNISKKENKERKEGKEGKDSIIKMNTRNKNDNANTGNSFDLDKIDDECIFNPKTNKYYKSKQNNNIRSFEKINNENNSSSFLNKKNDNKNNLRRLKGDYYNNSTNYANNNVINNELEKMVENMSKYNGNMSNSRYIPKKLSYRKEFNQMYPSNSYQEIPFYSEPNMNENENYNDLVNNYLNEDYDFYKNEQDYIKKVQEKIFLLKIQKMDKIAEECTFTPEINEVPRYLYRNKNGENNMTDININYENNYKNNIYNINNKFSSNSLNNSKSFSKRRKNKLIDEFTDNNYNVYPKRRKHHSKDSHSYSNSKIKNNEYSVYKAKKDKLMKLFSEQYPFMPNIRENKKFKIKSTFDERQKKFIEDKKKKFKEKEQEELKEIEEMKKYYNKSKTNIQKLVKKLYDDEAEKIKERLKTEKEKSKKKKIIDWDKRNKLNREKYPEEYKINIKSKDRQKHPNLKLENYSSVSKEKETKNISNKRTNTSKNKKKKKENIPNKNDINTNQKLLLEKIKDEHVIGFKNNVPANSNKLNNEIKNNPEINQEKKEDKKNL